MIFAFIYLSPLLVLKGHDFESCRKIPSKSGFQPLRFLQWQLQSIFSSSRHSQIRLAQCGHSVQKLLTGSLQQYIAGSSPLRQGLGFLNFGLRKIASAVQCPADNRHDCHDACGSGQRPSESPPGTESPRCRSGLGCNDDARGKVGRRLLRFCNQRQQHIQLFPAGAQRLEFGSTIRTMQKMIAEVAFGCVCQRRLRQLVLPFCAGILHFIFSNKSFLAVCSRERTVPAGSASTSPTCVASISSTNESCKTLRNFLGSFSIAMRSCLSRRRSSASFAPSSACGTLSTCQVVSRSI